MSQDERVPSPIDDGEIHEWLDGELSDARAAELEALTHSSAEFAQRVADARGLIAASSRILGALDHVPAGVLPKASGVPIKVATSRSNRLVARGQPRWSLRRMSGIAALLMVGVTGVIVARREPELRETDSGVGIVSETAPMTPENVASTADVTEGARDLANRSASDASAATGATVAPTASAKSASAGVPVEAAIPAAPAPSPAVAIGSPKEPVSSKAVATAARSSELGAAELATRRAAQLSVDSQVTVQRAAVQGERPMQLRAAPAMQRAQRFSSAAVAGAPGANRADAVGFAEVQSEVLPAELLLGVQRVQCAPTCVQLRVEIARDGRVRRWVQSLGSATTADTATLNAATVTSLQERIATLQLHTLPAVLQLDGAKCRSVGSLRESLRVSFIYNDAPRQVMGLPWCTDGTHVLDRAAKEIEDTAVGKLGPLNRE